VALDDKGEVIDGALAPCQQIQDKLSQPEQDHTTWPGRLGYRNRQPALVDDTAEDPRWLPRDGEERRPNLSLGDLRPPITQDRVVGVVTHHASNLPIGPVPPDHHHADLIVFFQYKVGETEFGKEEESLARIASTALSSRS
jgi:hypothetical protein